METDKLTNRNNVNSSKKLRYTPLHKETAAGYGFSNERISGAVHLHTKKRETSNSFGNSDSLIGKSSEVTELTKLRPRGAGGIMPSYSTETSSFQAANVVFLERDILPSDTLQSFALLYGCSVNDLKRANNLINEQGFFALRRLKIPVKKHGLLTVPEEEIKRRPVATTSLTGGNAGPSTNHHLTSNDVYHRPNDNIDFDDVETAQFITSKLTNVVNKEATIDENDTGKFLKSVDKEIRKTIKMTDKIGIEKNEALEEVVSSLGSVGYRPLPLPTARAKECDGASWGVKWSTLLVIFILCLIMFIIFAAYKFSQADHSSPGTDAGTIHQGNS